MSIKVLGCIWDLPVLLCVGGNHTDAKAYLMYFIQPWGYQLNLLIHTTEDTEGTKMHKWEQMLITFPF